MSHDTKMMKWQRLGLLFAPHQHSLPHGCREFAQSPQALVLPDRVRIYFSTRSIDINGKYLSHIAYVDMNRNLTNIIEVSRHTVVPLGGLGSFDEHGIFPMNVLPVGDEIWGYTTGWNRRLSVSVDTAIGRVVSRDGGRTFVRLSEGPVLGPSLHEPFLVGDGFVRLIDGCFHMWYIFGTHWRRSSIHKVPERTYKIAHAKSLDGVNWLKDEARQIIPDRLGEDESQALPTVVSIKDKHHMFFCYRESFDFRFNSKRSYRIGHAWSDDLTHWMRTDDIHLSIKENDWDSEMQCYPHAFVLDEEVYLLYNGNSFGRAGFGAAKLISCRECDSWL